MESGTGPKANMACLVDAAEVMGKSQDNVPDCSALSCFLSSANGDPIITHSWFIAHWPEPLAERTSVILASSKYRDVKTWQYRRVSASNNLENLLKEVTASGSANKSPE